MINYKTQGGSHRALLDIFWSFVPRKFFHLCCGVSCCRADIAADFAEEITKITDGVDLVIDFVGKTYFEPNLKVMRRDATLIYLSFLSGAKLENANLSSVSPPAKLHHHVPPILSLGERERGA